ncbi:MAG TPA: Do family serine endopeptidase [Steroidobacteraceae bacterium]|nr:Do family serine endopeptidase [Steroidobacteraceae bacterium]
MQLKRTTLALSASGLFACGAVVGWVGPGLLGSGSLAAAATAPAAQPIPLGSAPNYRAIVAQNRAAVVTITSRTMEQESNDQGDLNGLFGDNSPFGNDPFFRFFRELPNEPRNVPVESLGSGFIVQPDGVILTNAHVVRNATHVTVKLADNREYRAKVVGLDKSTDVAVLKIDARDLPTVRLGNSNNLQVGDYVLALGAPYGLTETASAGIVSAIGRELPDNQYVPFIQTDVAVNPGNSGGPLFNEHGAVVGINSQIYSNTGGFEGVSFAVPIDVAIHDEQQILAHGKVEHARLGVEVQAVTQALARSFNLNAPQGALVAQVEPNSPAERAGIKTGDVILRLNGQPVSDSGSLAAQIGMMEPGTAVTLDIWRNGKTFSEKVTLGNSETKPQQLQASNTANLHGKLGLTVRPLTSDEKEQAGVPSGLLVEQSTGPAADAGIQPGDIVLSADGTPLSSIGQLRKIVSNHKNTIALLVQHGNERIFVPVQLG